MEKTELAEKWLRAVYGGNAAVVDDLGSDDVLITYPIFETLFGRPVLKGKPAVLDFARGFSSRWQDVEVVFHETIAQDDKVVLVWSFQGRAVGTIGQDGKPADEMKSWGGITLIRFNEHNQIVAEIGEESDPGPMRRLTTDTN